MASTCATCATELPAGARFCLACGAAQPAPGCVSCGVELPSGSRFCLSCGAPQPTAAAGGEPRAAAAGGPSVARRVTSVLFGDLVGFTALSETRDQEDVRELLTAYFDECRRIISRYGGTVEKFIGDAVMAVWGVPTAHEDDAERAVRAGLELISAIEAMGAQVGVPDLAMRVGIVTGEVAVSVGAEAQGMVAGDAVNTASRVQAAASPGQIWVDETTRLLTSSAISYADAGSHVLKGKADPVPLWAVRAVVAGVGGAQRADGLEAPLVGRDRELRLVKELFHGIEDSRRPALLVVDGEAGVGKTRLGWEFEKYVDGLNYVARWHSGRCLAYGEGVAYYALAEAIRARLLLLAADAGVDEEDENALLELGLTRYVPDGEEREWLRPRLGALLGIGTVGSPSREDLFSAWTTFLHRTGEDEHPVVLVIDDAHHADDSLLQFLDYLLSVGDFGCLVLLLTRPGLLETNPGLATNRRATVLHLEALSDTDVGRLLDGLLAGLPEAARTSLVDRSDGVPLFAVETVRSLIDRDLVVPRGGQYVLADPDTLDLDSIGAPASLQALIAARLDTLDTEQRQVLDRASVIGDAFDRALIARLCPEVPDVQQALDALVRLQLVSRESNRFTTEHGQFRFVQGAVRQVAYGTLSRQDRKQGHLAVVEALMADASAAGERAPIVAKHLLEALDAAPDAGDAATLADRAVVALRDAAARAQALGAPREAAAHLTEALDRCVEPADRAGVETDLARALDLAGRHDGAVEHAERALALYESLGDEKGAGLAVAILGRSMTSVGRYEDARDLADTRYALVRARGDLPEVELELMRVRASSRMRNGEEFLEEAAELARLAEYVGDRGQIAFSFGLIALHFQASGARALGRLLLEGQAEVARELHDSAVLAAVLSNLCADCNCDDLAEADDFGTEGLAVARTLGDHAWLSVTSINLMTCLLGRGDWDRAQELADEGGLVDDLYAPYLELVRSVLLRARGGVWSPGQEYLREASGEDEGSRSLRELVTAIEQADRGPDAVDTALRAADRMHALVGFVDDFPCVYAVAVDLLADLGAHEGLARLLHLVDANEARVRLPAGTLSSYHRARALHAQHGGADPERVEGDFREALRQARSWKSETWAARIHADLGTWLVRQGRAEEAGEPLRAARAGYERLAAARWLEQLDAALSGVPT
ncbi:adenylate/guanylate cyclase domain-containing protein [Nocardioides aestuarii]|uniref:Adenylate/guanylate cyclase domain-containing protein n=1 Tax=Nocardioides aestuarii TaxID=252231 RepID=A0ABW4TSC3_9ACTN